VRYTTQDEVKKALSVQQWDKITPEQFQELIRLKSQVDQEQMRKIVEQIPNFIELSRQTLSAVENVANRALDANKESQSDFNARCKDVIRILEGQLNGRSFSDEHKLRIMEMLYQILSMQSRKDSENKSFLAAMFVGAGTLFLAIAAGVWGLAKKKAGA